MKKGGRKPKKNESAIENGNVESETKSTPTEEKDIEEKVEDSESDYEESFETKNKSAPAPKNPTSKKAKTSTNNKEDEESFETKNKSEPAPKSPSSKKAKTSTNNKEDEVEQIVDMEINQRRKCPIKFRVRWVGYKEEDDSWLLLTDLNCDEMIADFLEVSGRKPEYEKSLETKTKSSLPARDAPSRRARVSYSELPEDEEEVIPSGTQSRKAKRAFRNEGAVHRPKKMKASKKTEPEEYEVLHIVDKRVVKHKTEYKVRWKGYTSSSDSWVGKGDLNCTNLVEMFEGEKQDESKEWKVESVVQMRTKCGKHEYLVHWKGYSSTSDTWEPEENVAGCDQLNHFLKSNTKTVKKESTAKKTPAAAEAKPRGRPSRQRN